MLNQVFTKKNTKVCWHRCVIEYVLNIISCKIPWKQPQQPTNYSWAGLKVFHFVLKKPFRELFQIWYFQWKSHNFHYLRYRISLENVTILWLTIMAAVAVKPSSVEPLLKIRFKKNSVDFILASGLRLAVSKRWAICNIISPYSFTLHVHHSKLALCTSSTQF